MNNNNNIQFIPKGFRAAGVSCGIKKNGRKDLALIVSSEPATAAGVFTTNIVKGHSLKWSMDKIKNNRISAIAVNSGNANACVGSGGDADAELMASFAAKEIGCKKEQILLASTGIIGYRLPMDKIEAGIKKAYASLSDNFHDAAVAIMTTDTFEKEASARINLSGKPVTIYGMAKGSGMIHPNMATMIGIILTDANISSTLLKRALDTVVNKSFNRISVDGDTSVCDKVLLLANSMAGNNEINAENEDYSTFLAALTNVAVTLSKMLARDGEGATKLAEIRVKNADTRETAHRIANAISKSPLVKTALFGEDANWGRILTAAGYSGAVFNPDTVDIYIGDVLMCKNGTGLQFDEQRALTVLKRNEITITVDFKMGDAEDMMWTCDLSYDYVKINGSYRT
ncbi:MAG: bifunctional glutamate N-acetyltransferase/amino-acid acetyltransferase ArgJ [Clostridiaceae bacterium]|nr:bifunctional glutamate N-acetyltransferase/amino-acid acetyltransferase ArgJ [Clostridiaceae bacterium]